MSQPIVKYWAPSSGNTATISSSQAYTAAGSVKINSNAEIGTPNPGPYIYKDMVRKIALTSTANVSAVNFTVTGIGSSVDGAGNPTQVLGPISEVIAGPNITTVQSVNIYSRINSITFNAPVANLSVGFGVSGIISYIFPDYNRTGWYAQVQAAPIANANLTYNMYVSLTKPEDPTTDGRVLPYPGGAIPAFQIGTNNSNVNQLFPVTDPITLIWATIAANTAVTPNESLYLTFLQQGTRS